MGHISIHFYGGLKDFLPDEQRDSAVTSELIQSRSVKDFIESLGVPHTEVDLIIVDGVSVDFDFLLQAVDGEAVRVSVYPPLNTDELQHVEVMHEGCSRALLKHLQPVLPAEIHFVLDVHLGRLAAYLRMLGFDTLYRNDYPDAELADISAEEKRILLTCDRQLLMRSQVIYGYFVRSRQPKKQLLEILSRFDLHGKQKPFTRCMHCNGKNLPVDKSAIGSQLQAKTKQYYDEFYRCQSCGKIYWKGSHFSKMQAMIDAINPETA